MTHRTAHTAMIALAITLIMPGCKAVGDAVKVNGKSLSSHNQDEENSSGDAEADAPEQQANAQAPPQKKPTTTGKLDIQKCTSFVDSYESMFPDYMVLEKATRNEGLYKKYSAQLENAKKMQDAARQCGTTELEGFVTRHESAPEQRIRRMQSTWEEAVDMREKAEQELPKIGHLWAFRNAYKDALADIRQTNPDDVAAVEARGEQFVKTAQEMSEAHELVTQEDASKKIEAVQKEVARLKLLKAAVTERTAGCSEEILRLTAKDSEEISERQRLLYGLGFATMHQFFQFDRIETNTVSGRALEHDGYGGLCIVQSDNEFRKEFLKPAYKVLKEDFDAAQFSLKVCTFDKIYNERLSAQEAKTLCEKSDTEYKEYRGISVRQLVQSRKDPAWRAAVAEHLFDLLDDPEFEARVKHTLVEQLGDEDLYVEAMRRSEPGSEYYRSVAYISVPQETAPGTWTYPDVTFALYLIDRWDIKDAELAATLQEAKKTARRFKCVYDPVVLSRPYEGGSYGPIEVMGANPQAYGSTREVDCKEVPRSNKQALRLAKKHLSNPDEITAAKYHPRDDSWEVFRNRYDRITRKARGVMVYRKIRL